MSHHSVLYYSQPAIESVGSARDEAELACSAHVRTEHILCGLASVGTGVAATTLGSFGVSVDTLRAITGRGKHHWRRAAGQPPYAVEEKRVLWLAKEQAERRGHERLESGDILLAIATEEERNAPGILARLGLEAAEVAARVEQVRQRSGPEEPTEDRYWIHGILNTEKVARDCRSKGLPPGVLVVPPGLRDDADA